MQVKVITVILACVMAVSCTGNKHSFRNVEKYSHEDGTYRGSFIDRGLIQVNIQFVLRDGIVTEAS